MFLEITFFLDLFLVDIEIKNYIVFQIFRLESIPNIFNDSSGALVITIEAQMDWVLNNRRLQILFNIY